MIIAPMMTATLFGKQSVAIMQGRELRQIVNIRVDSSNKSTRIFFICGSILLLVKYLRLVSNIVEQNNLHDQALYPYAGKVSRF